MTTVEGSLSVLYSHPNKSWPVTQLLNHKLWGNIETQQEDMFCFKIAEGGVVEWVYAYTFFHVLLVWAYSIWNQLMLFEMKRKGKVGSKKKCVKGNSLCSYFSHSINRSKRKQMNSLQSCFILFEVHIVPFDLSLFWTLNSAHKNIQIFEV